MVIKFDGVEKPYTAIVAGDINGDGLANQVDLQLIIKHILGTQNSELKGISLISADLNNDGQVNQMDLRMMIDYIVYGRLVVEVVDKPTSPKIEVVSGSLGDNEYYTTYPVIKIVETQPRNVGKTTYKLEGAEQKEETEIENNGRITLSKNGTYIITSYTYSKEGLKSRSNNQNNKSRCRSTNSTNNRTCWN